ncbi:DotG/IcmE/VirB10 family protein [Pelomonas sp. APW6]|uniref:DotG/IcmE/VirB10 family protein n=1 Tax=Roseateles subflavus TaxID=3053353 RepID=A0ABT7LQ77_9BURK|nr:DotG/IcmE/VirB10 family protein [Pelomonas sp. APW6]MDL5034300.1 DotG/IcmE/VirB10 family protein [Pelomonas sp. APW6]
MSEQVEPGGDDLMPPQPQGKTLDKGLKRNLLIIGGVLALAVSAVVLMFLSRSSGSADGKGNSDVNALRTTVPSTGQTNQQGLSPAARDMVQRVQLEEAEAARKRGQSYVPADQTGTPIKLDAQGREIQGGNQYGQPGGSQYVPNAQANTQPIQVTEQERRRDDMRRKGLEMQLAGMLKTMAISGEAPTHVEFKAADSALNGARTGAQQGQSGNPGDAQVPQGADAGPILVDALEIFAGVTASPMDTYKTSWASARITSGRLAGAYLIGNSTMIDEGLQVAYTAMRWNGKTYKIDAVALDESEATNAVTADLDRRYLQRYVMPVLMAAVGGYATARAQTGSEVVMTAGGVSVSQPPATKQQAINAGIASAMGIAQRAVDKEAQMPIRATLPANSSIGIMFRQPLHLGDQGTTASTGVTKPNSGIAAVQGVQLGAGGRQGAANPYQVNQTPATNQGYSVPGFNGQVPGRIN